MEEKKKEVLKTIKDSDPSVMVNLQQYALNKRVESNSEDTNIIETLYGVT